MVVVWVVIVVVVVVDGAGFSCVRRCGRDWWPRSRSSSWSSSVSMELAFSVFD